MKNVTKKSLKKDWSNKRKQAKQIYDKVKSQNPEIPGFYNSDIYKEIKRREKKAVYYYENKERINKERRDKYAAKKEFEEIQEDNGIIYSDEVTVFEAYSGSGRVFENEFRELVKSKNSTFYGEVIYDGKKHTFIDIRKYGIFIHRILKELYSGKSGNEAQKDQYLVFNYMVNRSYAYNKDQNKFFVLHEFSDEENE